MKQPNSTFIIYAREDGEVLKELKKHLQPLVRSNEIDLWDEGMILAGAEWSEEIKERLNASDIVLLLISASFFNSQYIFEVELQVAIERYEKSLCIIIPIIVADCYWEGDLGQTHERTR